MQTPSPRISSLLAPFLAVALGFQPVLAAVDCACSAGPAAGCACAQQDDDCGCASRQPAMQKSCCGTAGDESAAACNCHQPQPPIPAQPEPPANPRTVVTLALPPQPVVVCDDAPPLDRQGDAAFLVSTGNLHQSLLGVWLI